MQIGKEGKTLGTKVCWKLDFLDYVTLNKIIEYNRNYCTKCKLYFVWMSVKAIFLMIILIALVFSIGGAGFIELHYRPQCRIMCVPEEFKAQQQSHIEIHQLYSIDRANSLAAF